jgi:hypothetical protein
MRTIGTDVSLKVCKQEGYLMMQFDARKKFNPETDYNIFGYYPDYVISEAKGTIPKDALIVDTVISWKELQAIYAKHKEGIDKFSDDMPEIMSKGNPDFYDLLNAAATVNSYCGLP